MSENVMLLNGAKEEGIKKMVDSFERWLRETIGNENDSTMFTGYQLNILDDRHEVVFAYKKNGEVGWWKNLGEDDD